MKKLFLSKGEDQIFNLIIDALHKSEINYICDLGLRFFYPNGYSYGFCTNSVWKNKKLQSDYHNLSSMFYSNELLRMKRNNYCHSIRIQGQCHHEFLKQISEQGLGNVLVLYIFNKNKIIGFYFLIPGNDIDAVNRFHNDKNSFQQIVKNLQSKVEKIEAKYNMKNFAIPLLSEYVTSELFQEKKKHEAINNIGEKVILTNKQSQILEILGDGCTRSKEIASLVGVTPKQVDKHVSALKSIFCVNGRNQLINIARQI